MLVDAPRPLAANARMVLPPDAALIRHDPILVGLATLLDADALVGQLRRASARDDLGAAQLTYVRYRPWENCLAGYQLQVAQMMVQVHAMAHRPDARTRFRKARKHPGVAGPLGLGRFVLDDCAIVVAVFPNDRAIRGLPCLAHVEARQRLLRALMPERPDLWDGTLDCLAYKPERRYVARLRGRHGADAVLKVYSEEEYRVAHRPAPVFAARGALRLPRCLGRCAPQAVVTFEWLPGRVLSQTLGKPCLEPATLSAVGAALAELHAQEPDGRPPLTADAEAARLGDVAHALSLLYPSLARRVQNLARWLGTSLRDEVSGNRPLHGDFNPSQVLLAGKAVALLDLDRVVRGDPAFDLGNFLACLEQDSLRGSFSPGRVAALGNDLLQGYGAARDASLPVRIRLCTAAALFCRLDPYAYWEPPWQQRKSPRCWEPHWSERVEALLDRVEKLARGK
jgi:aminoglycoside phosphotransferase (APT) family kinase protein